jgi:peroxin-3
MINATRNWVNRNRSRFAVGAGVVGATYLAGQYVIGKIGEARQRMAEDRISRENLRRRFEQNQQDCSFTVLAILPTATENILEALPAENILAELQQEKSERLARSMASETAPSEILSADVQSTAPSVVTEGDEKSVQSESFVHASQISTGKPAEGEATKDEKPPSQEPPAASAQPASPPPPPKKSKALLWNDLKLICKLLTDMSEEIAHY